jgi:hypothetical protein
MQNAVYRTAAGVFAAVLVLSGAEPDPVPAAELIKQLRQLRLEFTVHLLECGELELRKLERRAAKAAAGSHSLEAELTASRQDAMALDAQLVRPELSEEERAELDRIRFGPLRESDDRLQRRQAVASNEETALRIQAERQRRAVEELRRTLLLLRNPESAAKN